MLFSRGFTSSIDVIVDLFLKYVSCLGQVTNPSKSILYDGSMSSFRHSILADMIGLSPFFYLGVPIFKGRPKAAYFLFTTYKFKNKLVARKASLLSIIGRV